jgi:ribose transport system permease protein
MTSSNPAGTAEPQGAPAQPAGGESLPQARTGSLARLQELSRRALAVESNSVLVATIALIVVIGVFHPNFLSVSQLKAVVQQAAYVGVIAAGMAFLISMREIDLSVGSMFGLSVIVAGLLMQHGMDPWLAAAVGIGSGCAMGLLNAILVQAIAIPTIIATLATLSMYRGLATALAKGQQVTSLPVQSSFFTFLGGNKLGLPVSVWILILVTIVLTLVLRLTPFGYRVRAIGSSPEAASFSGISIARVRVQTLVMIGALCGLAGMLGLAYFESGDPNIGSGFELQAIAAAVIGGTPLRGGSATVVGAVLGAILLSAVTSGLAYFNVPVNWSSFATGLVILVAVALDSLLRSRRRRRTVGLGL